MKDFLVYALAFLTTNIPFQLLNRKFNLNHKLWAKIKVKYTYRFALFIVVGSIIVGLLSAILNKFVPSSYDEYINPLLIGIFIVFIPNISDK